MQENMRYAQFLRIFAKYAAIAWSL